MYEKDMRQTGTGMNTFADKDMRFPVGLVVRTIAGRKGDYNTRYLEEWIQLDLRYMAKPR
jgi:hypothetical protein